MAKKEKTFRRFSGPNRGAKPKPCFFCLGKSRPDYQKAEELRRFVNERGKILARGRTGICRKHQRELAIEIKRARFLALLPFLTQVR